MTNFGAVPAGAVLPVVFNSFDGGTGASITLTGLAITDVEIYKGVSMTQRTSDVGVVLLDTDGIDIDGVTGIHGFSIDTGDNTDAGFYAVGSFFTVVVSAVTIDAQTVNFVAATFRLVAAEAVAGKPKADVDAWLGTAAATPTVAGVPEVDLTHVAGSTTSVSALASGVATVLADWNNGGRLDLILDIIAADTTTDIPALIATLQAFVDTEVAAILVDTGTTLQAELDAIQAAVITNAAGVDIAADIIALKAETAAILVDTGTTLQAELDAIEADVDAILVDTGTTLQGEVDGIQATVDAILVDTAVIGALGAGLTALATQASVDAVKADTAATLIDTAVIGALGAGLTAVPWNADWDAQVQSEVTDALQVTIPDSIPADGTAPSVQQALYMLTQFMLERSVASTTVTVAKPDGTTALFTLTLDDDTTPTSITRA